MDTKRKEILVAKSAGFCFGVKRAVDMVYEELKKGGQIYTYGEIIHNETVVSDLEKRGVRVLNGIEELSAIENGSIIIRSHGVGRNIYKIIEEKPGLKLVDATCPFVEKIHRIVEKESGPGRQLIIIGNPRHPEVEGIVGFANGPCCVIETPEEAWAWERADITDQPGANDSEMAIDSCDKDKEICIVAQTTFNLIKFKYLVEIFNKKGYSINAVNTICSATEQRQSEARFISSRVGVMIVIGGSHSSNTRKLFEICSEECEDVRLIQSVKDLSGLPGSEIPIGITAGASTPNYIIEEVLNYVRGTDV